MAMIFVYREERRAEEQEEGHASAATSGSLSTPSSSLTLATIEAESDECALYFVYFILDMVFGLFLIWCLVHAQEVTAARWKIDSLRTSGFYGDPPSFNWYFQQLCMYMLMLTLVKTIISAFFLAFHVELSKAAAWLFKPLADRPDVELLVVMVLCPWILNTVQFWILDTILMRRKPKPGAGASSLEMAGGYAQGYDSDSSRHGFAASREAGTRGGAIVSPMLDDKGEPVQENSGWGSSQQRAVETGAALRAGPRLGVDDEAMEESPRTGADSGGVQVMINSPTKTVALV